jgi:phospholipid transport system transporter-binding protein
METLEGELSFATVPRLLQRADSLLDGGVLDLSRVSRVDSAGLALLLELSRRSRSRGTRLGIRGMNPQILSLTGFFGLDKVLNLE